MSSRPRRKLRRARDVEEQEDEEEIRQSKRHSKKESRRHQHHLQELPEEEEFGGAEAHEEVEERQVAAVRRAEDPRMRSRDVADVMRCVLFRNIKHLPTRSADISKVLKEKRVPRATVVQLAIKQFKNIFGYEMMDISALDEVEEEEEEEDASKKAKASSEKAKKKKKVKKAPEVFILKNMLQNEQWIQHIIALDKGFASVRALIMTVFGLIYLKGGQCSESVLFDSLQELGLDPRSKSPSLAFGSVSVNQIITSDFIKSKFLTREKTAAGSFENMPSYEYRIGPRGEVMVPRLQLIKFLNKVIGKQVNPVEQRALEEEEAEEAIEDDE